MGGHIWASSFGCDDLGHSDDMSTDRQADPWVMTHDSSGRSRALMCQQWDRNSSGSDKIGSAGQAISGSFSSSPHSAVMMKCSAHPELTVLIAMPAQSICPSHSGHTGSSRDDGGMQEWHASRQHRLVMYTTGCMHPVATYMPLSRGPGSWVSVRGAFGDWLLPDHCMETTRPTCLTLR